MERGRSSFPGLLAGVFRLPFIGVKIEEEGRLTENPYSPNSAERTKVDGEEKSHRLRLATTFLVLERNRSELSTIRRGNKQAFSLQREMSGGKANPALRRQFEGFPAGKQKMARFARGSPPAVSVGEGPKENGPPPCKGTRLEADEEERRKERSSGSSPIKRRLKRSRKALWGKRSVWSPLSGGTCVRRRREAWM